MIQAQMNHDEVKERLARIKKYNAHFKGTEHVVNDGQIYGFMTDEWHVDPAKYGFKKPEPRAPLSKDKIAQRVTEPTKTAVASDDQKKGMSDAI